MNNGGTENSLFNFIYAISRRRRAIIWITAASLFFTIVFTFLMTPKWEATALILLEANPKRQLATVPDLSTPGPPTSPEVQAHNFVAVLSGRNMAYQIVNEFALDDSLRKRKTDPDEARDVIKKLLVDIFRSPILLLRAVHVLKQPEYDWVDEAADDLIDKAEDIQVVEGTQVISLTISGDSPQLATDIANRMPELLQEKTISLSQSEAELVYHFSANQQKTVEENLRAARAKLRQFLQANVVVDMTEEKKQKVQRIENLRMQHLEVENNKRVVAAQLEEVNRQLGERDPKTVGSALLTENPLLWELRSELSKAEVELVQALTEKTAKHPDVIRIQDTIDKLKATLVTELTSSAQNHIRTSDEAYNRLLNRSIELETELLTADVKLDALAKSLSDADEILREIPAKEMELASLNDEVTAWEAMDRSIRARLEELRIVSNLAVDDNKIRIVERAYVSPHRKPDWPKTPINIIVGLLFGIIAGGGYALFAEYWNGAFRTRDEIEEATGLPVVGDIPGNHR